MSGTFHVSCVYFSNIIHHPLTESSLFFSLLHHTFLIYLCPLFPYSCMFSLTFCLHFVLCSLRLWKDPMVTHLHLISPFILNSSVGVYMAEFCIMSADHNWLVRRYGLIILHSLKGTCEVLFDWQREFQRYTVMGHFWPV